MRRVCLAVLRRLAGGVAVVVAVLAITWTLLYVLRPNLVTDGRAFPVQLGDYLQHALLHLDLGQSRGLGNLDVAHMVRERLPADIAVLTGGLVLGIAGGIGLGALLALNPRSPLARAGELLGLIAFGTPVYVVSLSLLLLFGQDIASLVPLGIPLRYVEFDHSHIGWLKAIVFPWIVLSLPLAGQCFRLMAGTTRAATQEPWTQTARAKGLTERGVILRHAARAGVPPTLSLAGSTTNVTLLNLALVEHVFSVPGLYEDFDQAVASSDAYPLIALAGVTAALVVIVNGIVDAIAARLDPRVAR